MKVFPVDDPNTAVSPERKFTYPSSFLQTPFWAKFKEAHGWKPLYFGLETSNSAAVILLVVLVRRFSRFASIAYVPMGPDLAVESPETQGQFLTLISSLLTPYLPKNTMCIRFDPPWGLSVSNCALYDEDCTAPATTDCFPVHPPKPVRTAPANIQPPDTVVLDLTKSSETLLLEMKSKWRYNIKLSVKKGVTVKSFEGEEGAREGIDIFYRTWTPRDVTVLQYIRKHITAIL